MWAHTWSIFPMCIYFLQEDRSNFGYFWMCENFSDSSSTQRYEIGIHSNYVITVMGTIEVFSSCFAILTSYYQRVLRIWRVERHKIPRAVEFTSRAETVLCWEAFVDTPHLEEFTNNFADDRGNPYPGSVSRLEYQTVNFYLKGSCRRALQSNWEFDSARISSIWSLIPAIK